MLTHKLTAVFPKRLTSVRLPQDRLHTETQGVPMHHTHFRPITVKLGIFLKQSITLRLPVVKALYSKLLR